MGGNYFVTNSDFVGINSEFKIYLQQNEILRRIKANLFQMLTYFCLTTVDR